MERGDEMGSHPRVHGEPGGDEADEGSEHCRDGPTHDEPSRKPEQESEYGIADWSEIARTENEGIEGLCTHRVNRARPPGHHKAEQAGHDHTGPDTHPELGGEPTRAGDALSPRKAVGARLELACNEWRTPKHPDQRRYGE